MDQFLCKCDKPGFDHSFFCTKCNLPISCGKWPRCMRCRQYLSEKRVIRNMGKSLNDSWLCEKCGDQKHD